jgi:hypothetical protein
VDRSDHSNNDYVVRKTVELIATYARFVLFSLFCVVVADLENSFRLSDLAKFVLRVCSRARYVYSSPDACSVHLNRIGFQL